MKTEKANLPEFCGGVVLFLAGAYFLPKWTAWGICDSAEGNGVCRRGLLTGIFTAAYVAAFLGQAWLNARLARAEERRGYQRAALFLWLYLALCGTGLTVKMLV